MDIRYSRLPFLWQVQGPRLLIHLPLLPRSMGASMTQMLLSFLEGSFSAFSSEGSKREDPAFCIPRLQR